MKSLFFFETSFGSKIKILCERKYLEWKFVRHFTYKDKKFLVFGIEKVKIFFFYDKDMKDKSYFLCEALIYHIGFLLSSSTTFYATVLKNKSLYCYSLWKKSLMLFISTVFYA